MTSQHAVYYRSARTMVPGPVEVDPPGAGEVQIEVAYNGICGTDLHIFHGDMDHRVGPPAIIGHEMSGRIRNVGDAVSGWSVDDHVTVMPLDWCGDCPACASGNSHICHNLNFIGIDSSGAIRQPWNVRSDLLVALPADLPLDIAALTEPLAVAVQDVGRGQVASGDNVVVIGGGPIGVLIGLVARDRGAQVLVSEPVAFEVSASVAGVKALTDVLKVRGVGVIVGIHTAPPPIDLFRVFWRELELRGARVYQRQDFETAVELLAAGRIPGQKLITKTVPADQAQAGFEALEAGGPVLKVLIECQNFSTST